MEGGSYRSGSGLAKLVFLLFGAGIVMQFLSIASDLSQIDLLQRIESGADDLTMEEVEASDSRVALIAILDIIVLFAGMIAFLFWLYRVRANLQALGITDARWSAGWAVGWWFIPIMSLFRPYQVVSEIWRASSPEASMGAWRSDSAPALLGWWWALFLIGSALSNFAGRMTLRDTENIGAQVTALNVYMVSEGVWVIGSILAIMVVRGIDRRQSERHSTYGHEGLAKVFS